MSLPARVKELRESLGMKQTDLADKIGVEASYISQIESGHRKPSLDLQDKLAIELHTSLADLLSAAGYKVTPPPMVALDKMTSTDIHVQVDRLLSELRRRELNRHEGSTGVRRLTHALAGAR